MKGPGALCRYPSSAELDYQPCTRTVRFVNPIVGQAFACGSSTQGLSCDVSIGERVVFLFIVSLRWDNQTDLENHEASERRCRKMYCAGMISVWLTILFVTLVDGIPTRAEDVGHLLAGQPLGPARQEPLVGRRQVLLE